MLRGNVMVKPYKGAVLHFHVFFTCFLSGFLLVFEVRSIPHY